MDMLSGNWTPGDPVSLSVTGELSTSGPGGETKEPKQPGGRQARRVSLDMDAALRQRGASGVSVQIMDLSTDGFRVTTHLDLFEGHDVWLRLNGLEACHAKVVWRSGPYVGCRFTRPLHPAVLDMVVARAKGG